MDPRCRIELSGGLQSGACLHTLQGHGGEALDVAFSPDGKYLATGGFEGRARVYALRLEDLVALARSRVTRALTTDECRKYLHVETCP